MASNTSYPPGSRTVRACTECKQAKLRCDSKAKFPNPCTRCHARQLFCTVDTAFQRTPARKRLEAMNRELQDLRSQLDGDRSTAISESAGGSAPSPNQPREEDTEDDFTLDGETISLYGTLTSSEHVVTSFREFIDRFRHRLPIIGSFSIRRMHDTQPFLFWTIVIIVASHLPGHPYDELYGRLNEPYRNLLKEELLDAPLPLHKIQALLYLCVWPLPVETQPKDPSWLYCGMAIQAARYMGLDREQYVPSLRTIGVVSGTAQARINTWIGCFYVSTSLSMHLGLRPPIDSDLDFTTIHSFLARKPVPFGFVTHVRIQLVVAKFTNLLIHNLNEAASASLMRLVDSELDILKSSPDEERGSHKTEFSILVAKLHFLALFITKSPPGSPFSELTLKSGLAAALRITYISTLKTRVGSALDDDERLALIRQQRSLPKNYYRGLAFATIFLLTFFHLNSAAPKEEQQSAASHIAFSQAVFETCSTNPRDEFSRAAKVFEILARLTPGTSNPTQLRLRHRMGVSILIDAVSTAGEIRGLPVELGGIQDSEPPEAADETEPWKQPPGPDMPYTMDQVNSSVDFLREFWDDPITNMWNFEVTSPPHE